MLRTEKRLAQMKAGERVAILADDPIAKIDIPLFCTQNGHECEMSVEGDVLRFEIVRAAVSTTSPSDGGGTEAWPKA